MTVDFFQGPFFPEPLTGYVDLEGPDRNDVTGGLGRENLFQFGTIHDHLFGNPGCPEHHLVGFEFGGESVFLDGLAGNIAEDYAASLQSVLDFLDAVVGIHGIAGVVVRKADEVETINGLKPAGKAVFIQGFFKGHTIRLSLQGPPQGCNDAPDARFIVEIA